MKIGIFGGSFNPVHTAHLIIAESCKEQYNLDKIIFVPVGIPSHRKNDLLDSKHRYEMLKIATSNNDEFEVSDIEIKDDKTSYTIDTLIKLKTIYKDAEIYEIIGGDSADYIEKWKNWKEILNLSKILVFGRNGYEEKKYENMYYVESPLIEISSTMIREKLKENSRLPMYCLDREVYRYIIKNNLYSGG